MGKKKHGHFHFFSAIFFTLVFLLNDGHFLFFIIISCITGFCLGADLILPPSIQADITDLHRSKFDEDISGVIFFLQLLLINFLLLLSVFLYLG